MESASASLNDFGSGPDVAFRILERQIRGAWLRKPRVVLADDNSQILSLVSRVLGGHCEIVGEAMDGEQAIEMTLRQQPDILVLDISMPRLNGIEVARRLAECGSTARIVFLTSLEDSEYVAAALRLGVHGFVSKKLLHKDLATAITTAIEGGTFYSRIPSHAPAAVFLDARRRLKSRSARQPGPQSHG